MQIRINGINKVSINLFLDSGAYSALNQGKEINILQYCQFIKDNAEHITAYANLDVIGDPEKTLENQKIMENEGLSPIPCYHYGEDIKYIIDLIEKDYEYIAIGGMAPIPSITLIPWLDRLFTNYICDTSGCPIVKTHGFGLTSVKIMIRYPWFSVDSSTWLMTSRRGIITFPKFKNGKPCYISSPIRIEISSKSPHKKIQSAHFSTMSLFEQKVITQYVEERGHVIGESQWDGDDEIIVKEGLCNSYKMRDSFNALYFIDLQNSLPKYPWALRRK